MEVAARLAAAPALHRVHAYSDLAVIHRHLVRRVSVPALLLGPLARAALKLAAHLQQQPPERATLSRWLRASHSGASTPAAGPPGLSAPAANSQCAATLPAGKSRGWSGINGTIEMNFVHKKK